MTTPHSEPSPLANSLGCAVIETSLYTHHNPTAPRSANPGGATPRNPMVSRAVTQPLPGLCSVVGERLGEAHEPVPAPPARALRVRRGPRRIRLTTNDATLLPADRPALIVADPIVQREVLRVRSQLADDVAPERDREYLRSTLTLDAAYRDWIEPGRRQAVAAGKLAMGSLAKDRQALRRWIEFTRPADLPAGYPWPGLPVGAITGRYVAEWLERLTTRYESATIESTWGHLRAMLSILAAKRILDAVPDVARPTVTEQAVRVWTDAELSAAYQALAPCCELQTAWVLANNAGLRTVDLWRLRWQDVDLITDGPVSDWSGHLSFTAVKTGKFQRVPLAAVTAWHLAQLPQRSTRLFEQWGNPHDTKDPERSYRSRSRRTLQAALLATVGLCETKPGQVSRATCNTRLERVRGGAGSFVLGHSLTLNSKHYYEPTEMVCEAVRLVRQPAAWLAAMKGN